MNHDVVKRTNHPTEIGTSADASDGSGGSSGAPIAVANPRRYCRTLAEHPIGAQRLATTTGLGLASHRKIHAEADRHRSRSTDRSWSDWISRSEDRYGRTR